MDQEGNNGRRRSSRLAARGVATTPKAELSVKRSYVKSSEKPKRSKRKTTEETIELPEAKKTKIEDQISSDEVEKNEIDTVDEVKNDISGISPIDVDDVEETNVLPTSMIENKDLPKIEEETAVPLEDSKDENVENLPVTNDEKEEVDTIDLTEDNKEKIIVSVEIIDVDEEVNVSVGTEDIIEEVNMSVETEDIIEEVNMSVETEDEKKEVNTSVETEDKKLEIKEDPIKTKSPEIIEQPMNDVSQDEPKQEPEALENSNGKSDEKETIDSVEEIVNNDIGFCVATENIVTPNGGTDEQVKSTNGGTDEQVKSTNGGTDEQVKSTNGDESIIEKEVIEPITVLHVDTKHVEETDLKAVTTTTAISTNNDVPIVEQVVEKELDKSADIVVDNNVSADDIAPKVDQISTVVS